MSNRLVRRMRRRIAVFAELYGKATRRGRTRASPPPPSAGSPLRATSESLAGQCAVVTGGSRGVGFVVAKALAEQGCRVAIIARDGTRAQAAAQAIGGGAIAVTADLASAEQTDRAFATIARELGGVDLLVNCAAIAEAPGRAIWELPADEVAAVITVNLIGAFNAAQAALRLMLPRQRGRIINASVAGIERPPPMFSAYMVSKFGLEGLTAQLAAEAGDRGIAVAALRIHSVRTDMTERGFGSMKASLLPEPESLTPAFLALAGAPLARISGRAFSAARLLADADAELQSLTPMAQVRAYSYPVYTHNGRTVDRTDTDFTIYDRAENHLGAAPEVVAAVTGAMNARVASVYPDETHAALRDALGVRFGLDPDCFAIGNGSWEVLDRILEMFTVTGSRVVSAKPGWFGFNMLVRKRALDAAFVPLRREGAGFAYDLDAVAAATGANTRLIYLISPSNPEGTVLKHDAFLRFLDRVPDSIPIVVDEAYAEYVDDPDALNLPALIGTVTRPLIGLRTFSKFYALASARVGYAYGRPEHVEPLKRGERIFSTSRLSEVAAVAALGAQDHRLHVFRTTTTERRRMAEALAGMGLDVVPSQAPFMLVELPDTLTKVVETFAGEGIYLGEKAFYRQSYILLPISTPEENSRNLAIFARLAGARPASGARAQPAG